MLKKNISWGDDIDCYEQRWQYFCGRVFYSKLLCCSVLFLSVFYSFPSWGAYTSYYRDEQTKTIDMNFGDKSLTLAENVPGGIFDGAANVNIGGNKYKTICTNGTNPKGQSVNTTGQYLYPSNGQSGSYTLVSLSDNLSAGISYYFGGETHYFPFTNAVEGAGAANYCDQVVSHSGNANYLLRLVVKKTFIGMSSFNQIIARRCAGSDDDTCSKYAEAWQYLRVVGSVTVPQTCEIQPGSVFEINLGDIAQRDIVAGGIGNRPKGFINRPLTVKVACSGGVEADALLNVRLEGTAAVGHPQALASDNPDVGVVITKSDGSTVLKPNDINSVIPMQLSNGQGSVVIQSYPISLTGNAPEVGLFTTLAYLRFDFT
ncbi:fimbrial protein [Klebsiella aerogenes]